MTEPPRSGVKNGDGYRYFLLVLLIGISGRLFLLWWFGAPFADAMSALVAHTPEYRFALTHHFAEYLIYNHTVPPLNIVRDWLAEIWFGPDRVTYAQLGLAAFLDTLAGAMTVLLARRFGIGVWLSVFAGLLVTSRLALWEARGLGEGWDALDPFLVTAFTLSLVKLVQEPRVSTAIIAGVVGGLTVLAFNFGAPMVVPAILCSAWLLVRRGARIRAVAVLLVILLIPPAAAIVSVTVKNGTEHGLWSMSSGAGQNIMQAYNSGLKDPSGRNRGAYLLAKRNGYPDWWLWCYDEAERRKLHPLPNWAGWYGTCMFRLVDGKIVPDYGPLQDYFRANPDPRMSALVEKDAEIARSCPWLWAGPVVSRNTGVSVAYGQISSRIMLDTLAAKPDYFVRRAYRTFFEHWLYNGALSFVQRNRAAYEEPTVQWLFNLAGIPLFYLGTALGLYYFVRTGVTFLRTRGRGKVEAGLAGAGGEAVLLSACIVPPLLTSILLACCENYRHSLMLLPLLLVLALDAVRRRSFWDACRALLGRWIYRLGRMFRRKRSASA